MMEKRLAQDAQDMRQWFEISNLKNIVRITGELPSPSGETKPSAADTLLLQCIAHDVREPPATPLNAIMLEATKILAGISKYG